MGARPPGVDHWRTPSVINLQNICKQLESDPCESFGCQKCHTYSSKSSGAQHPASWLLGHPISVVIMSFSPAPTSSSLFASAGLSKNTLQRSWLWSPLGQFPLPRTAWSVWAWEVLRQ